MTRLPVELACRLASCPPERRWLIDSLWAVEGVGIVGGEPRCCKSSLARDMAAAVASGTPWLRRFAVSRPGRVLLFAAENALHIVRQRIDDICHAAGLHLAALDIQVITSPTVRLDIEHDRNRLQATVAELAPRLQRRDTRPRYRRASNEHRWRSCI